MGRRKRLPNGFLTDVILALFVALLNLGPSLFTLLSFLERRAA